MTSRVTFGTRESALAMWQARRVVNALRQRFPNVVFDVTPLPTRGDTHDAPIPSLGAVGVFTRELEVALDGSVIDGAVHSLKDLPTASHNRLTLGAICFRDDVRDVLVSNGVPLQDLPAGARIGTSSPRRMAQIRALRPELRPEPIRGNVETRLAKVQRGEYEAAVMAAAGLHRLSRESEITEYFPTDRVIPAPGQGALAVQCRTSDVEMLALLKAIDEPTVRAVVNAERAFLAVLEGGCTAPVAAHATVEHDELKLSGGVFSLDGTRRIVVCEKGPLTDPASLGRKCAEQALRRGARDLMS